MKRMNDALEAAGGRITKFVGTMWCAIAFALLTLVSLPGALATGNLVTITPGSPRRSCSSCC